MITVYCYFLAACFALASADCDISPSISEVALCFYCNFDTSQQVSSGTQIKYWELPTDCYNRYKNKKATLANRKASLNNMHASFETYASWAIPKWFTGETYSSGVATYIRHLSVVGRTPPNLPWRVLLVCDTGSNKQKKKVKYVDCIKTAAGFAPKTYLLTTLQG